MLEFGSVKPQLCNLKVAIPTDKGLVWERKLNGIRAIVFLKSDGSYRIQARSGTDKTHLFPELRFPMGYNCVLDGEITCTDSGVERFTAMQHRVNNPADVEANMFKYPATFNAFDIIEAGSQPMWQMPLSMRKDVLHSMCGIAASGWTTDGEMLWEAAVREGWEGVVGKDPNAPYEFGKRRWVKIKTWHEGVFECVGATAGKGKRDGLIGALILKNGTQVGSGFSDEQLMHLSYLVDDCEPFMVRVKYVEETNAGKLLFPIFVGVA